MIDIDRHDVKGFIMFDMTRQHAGWTPDGGHPGLINSRDPLALIYFTTKTTKHRSALRQASKAYMHFVIFLVKQSLNNEVFS
ncbi:MAG: hypothetical protein R6V25_01240 [Desulfatiglandales bacterium]